MSVPTIDLSEVDAVEQNLTETISTAAQSYGFFQVTNHEVSSQLVERVWTQTRAFFDLPKPAKHALARSKENPRGFYDRELTKNRRDLKEVFDFAAVPNPDLPDDHPENRAAVDGVNRWPADLPEFRTTMLEYVAACERLSLRLLGCAGLKLPQDTLTRHFKPVHTCFARLNHYPLYDLIEPETAATLTPLGDMALHHHSHAGALTVLLQDDVGGLQLETDAGWVDVTPIDGALVVNCGDMVQIWSNDRYRAAVHRVRPMTGKSRYSIPFFFNPAYATNVAPLPTGDARRPKYHTVNWGEFRHARADGDFADYGHEIQIADFRV